MNELRTRPNQRTKRTGQFPITLPADHIRRMLERSASLLIRTAHTRPGHFEVHDGGVIRRNERHRRNLRSDLQSDPLAFIIEITEVNTCTLIDLELKTVRRTGFPTLEEFYLDWLFRRRRAQLDLELKLCEFQVADSTRYLHERIQHAYTSNPAEAVPEEPGSPRAAAALTSVELEEISGKSRERWDTEHRVEIARRTARSLTTQLKQAHARAILRDVDVTPEIQAIQRQLDTIRAKLGDAA